VIPKQALPVPLDSSSNQRGEACLGPPQGECVNRCGSPEEITLVLYNITRYMFRIMSNTEKTISFRADAEKIDALDSLAVAQDRPRSYLINEAITNYIQLHAYQDALVRKGLEEMRKGRVVSHDEVVRRLKKAGRGRR
jgi:predicted transcriptional regulator